MARLRRSRHDSMWGRKGMAPLHTLLVAQLVEALRYKPELSRFRFPIVSLEIFIDIILLAAM
jgi:hypothetical protein